MKLNLLDVSGYRLLSVGNDDIPVRPVLSTYIIYYMMKYMGYGSLSIFVGIRPSDLCVFRVNKIETFHLEYIYSMVSNGLSWKWYRSAISGDISLLIVVLSSRPQGTKYWILLILKKVNFVWISLNINNNNLVTFSTNIQIFVKIFEISVSRTLVED